MSAHLGEGVGVQAVGQSVSVKATGPSHRPPLSLPVWSRDPGGLEGRGPRIHGCHPHVPPVEGAVRHLGDAVWE